MQVPHLQGFFSFPQIWGMRKQKKNTIRINQKYTFFTLFSINYCKNQKNTLDLQHRLPIDNIHNDVAILEFPQKIIHKV